MVTMDSYKILIVEQAPCCSSSIHLIPEGLQQALHLSPIGSAMRTAINPCIKLSIEANFRANCKSFMKFDQGLLSTIF